ncbi:MAG: response regulator [Verrucomicrobiota bacterium]|nr:response regulator [Verrucomicrobiota bacterium]
MMNTRDILLVEDNPSDALLTQRAFKKSNVVNTLIIVRDGQEAIDYLFCTGPYATRDITAFPGVILLDLKLPKIDGLSVLEKIKADKRFQMIPVVVLTTSNEDNDLKRAYQLGANSYIRKPVDFTAFNTAVTQLGIYWLMLNELPPVGR